MLQCWHVRSSTKGLAIVAREIRGVKGSLYVEMSGRLKDLPADAWEEYDEDLAGEEMERKNSDTVGASSGLKRLETALLKGLSKR